MYCDTSTLLKYYLEESESEAVRAAIAEADEVVSSVLTFSGFAGNRYQEDGIAFEEYLQQQQVQDELDEINAKLDALDDIQARLNDLNDQ